MESYDQVIGPIREKLENASTRRDSWMLGVIGGCFATLVSGILAYANGRDEQEYGYGYREKIVY